MKIYKYKDYEEYKKVQIACNKQKLKKNPCWATQENIKIASEKLKMLIPQINFGICHGTRIGKEQLWFSQFLNCKVIGTELSPTAKDFPNTIEWDFHEAKEEWVDNVDFIYSNSLDHSYKPVECLYTWMSCLHKNGICVLEWYTGHNISSRNDPFAASLSEYKDMVSNWKYQMVKCPNKHVLIFIFKS